MRHQLALSQGDARHSRRGVPSELVVSDNTTDRGPRIALGVVLAHVDTIAGRPTGTTSHEWLDVNLTPGEARDVARELVHLADQLQDGGQR